MASIAKRGTRWIVRWRDARGLQHTRTCPTKASASELQLAIEVEQSQGRDWRPEVAAQPTPEPEGTGDCDLEQVLRGYIEHRSLRLRGTTLRRYGENLDLFVRYLRTRQRRGQLGLDWLTKPALEGFYAWLCEPENGLHQRRREPDTARKIVEVVQLAWRWADESERWQGIPRPRSIEMPRTPPKGVIAPTWDEMARCVLAFAPGQWHRKLGLMLYHMGLRVTETMLLEWRDIDLPTRTLTIRAEVTKNKKGRVIPVPTALAVELHTWERDHRYIIPSGRSEGERERMARSRDFRRAWQRAGARPAAYDQPHHAFRRGYKSGMLARGVPPDVVDYLQGHEMGGGSRSRYIDPWQAYDLPHWVDQVPPLPATPSASVVDLAGYRLSRAL